MTPGRPGDRRASDNPQPAPPNPHSAIRNPHSEGRWGLVAACAALMAITSGVWYTASVFLVALIQEFGWDYAATASIFSLFTILYGISGVLVGYLVDRIGPRRVVLASGALLAVALLGNSLATARWHLYLTHSLFTAVGLSGIGWVPVSVILARGFLRRRGLALGIASAGVGAGMTIFLPVTQAIIDRGGWRMAFVALAVISIAVVLPLGLFALRDAAVTLAAGGEGTQAPFPSGHWAAGPPVWTPVAAIRSETFWLVAGTFVFLNSPVQMVLTHHVAHLVGVGQPKSFVAGIAGLVGFASVAGKILWGYLSDRWWVEATYLAGIAFLVAGIAALLEMGPATPAWGLYGYAALMGLGYAVSPAMTPVVSARFFAGRHFGAIFGALNLVHHLGGASGMWLAGYARDVTGSYTLPFLLAIASSCLSLACVCLAAPRRLRP